MMNELQLVAKDGIVEVHASGKLTKGFSEWCVSAIEARIERFDKLRVLFVMTDFHGWTAGPIELAWPSVFLTVRPQPPHPKIKP